MKKQLRPSKFTAIARNKPSAPIKEAFSRYSKQLLKKGVKVLDYGCGKGFDVQWLREKGIDTEGFDPHFNNIPMKGQTFDFIFCTYVLNVLFHPFQRDGVIIEAVSRLKDGGTISFTTRSETEILSEAAKHGWKCNRDGWTTNSRTFQKGFNSSDLLTVIIKAVQKTNLHETYFLSYIIETPYKNSSTVSLTIYSKAKPEKK